MTFESLPYFEINMSDRPVQAHYSLIWINGDVKWLVLEQFEPKRLNKLAKSPVACFVVVVSQGIIFFQ